MAEALILDAEAVNALARPSERRVLAERALTWGLAASQLHVVDITRSQEWEPCPNIPADHFVTVSFSPRRLRAIVLNMALPTNLHDQLVHELAQLPDSERRAVVAAAEKAASRFRHQAVVSRQTLRSAVGIVKGQPADAIEDTASLYDG